MNGFIQAITKDEGAVKTVHLLCYKLQCVLYCEDIVMSDNLHKTYKPLPVAQKGVEYTGISVF